MFTSKLIPRFSWFRQATCALQAHGEILNQCVLPVLSTYCNSPKQKLRNYSTAADNTSRPRWVQLEPELDEALVPRKLSVSPLESWLSLRYSLPPLPESTQQWEDIELLEEKVLPISVPGLEDGEGSAPPLRCKNVLEIRRRKINRHKYRKLLKRTKFLRKRVLERKAKKKQRRFELDLRRIWRRAGLKKPSEGWQDIPQIFIKDHGNKRD
uniref:Small ribosomal subunit protein mS38 n=1 Tax=Monopterus albus TaxID=43700 RepID=A0A3Q3JTY2_MONAL|nr:aurora kinase A-interacting protein [Monopterus albus]